MNELPGGVGERTSRPLDPLVRLAGRCLSGAGLVAIGVVLAQNGLDRPRADATAETHFVPTPAPLMLGDGPPPVLDPPSPNIPALYVATAREITSADGPDLPAPVLPPTPVEGTAPSALPVPGLADAERPSPPPPTLDLALVPGDAALVVAARPAALLKRAELKSLYDVMVRSQPELRHYADLANLPGIEQITIVVARHGLSAAGLENGAALYAASGVIVRTTAPRDWKATLAAVAPGIPTDESRYAGRTYTRMNLGDSGMSVGMFTPDDRTAVMAGLPNLFGFMAAADQPARPVWAEAWSVLGGADLAIALDVGAARGQLEPLLAQAPELLAAAGIISPLWEDTTGLVLGARVSDGLAFDLIAASPSDASARNVAQTLEAVLTLSRNAAHASRGLIDRILPQAEGGDAAMLLPLAEISNRLLDATRVVRDGNLVRLRAATDQDVLSVAKPWVKTSSE